MSERSSGWYRKFDAPIALSDQRTLVTLHDAANYITALPDEESSAAEWQAAIEALILVVELGGPTMFARIGVIASFEPWLCSGVQIHRARNIIGATQAEEEPMTVFVYVNTSKQIGDKDHVKVFANVDVAEKWFEANDPEGVAFEYEVLE